MMTNPSTTSTYLATAKRANGPKVGVTLWWVVANPHCSRIGLGPTWGVRVAKPPKSRTTTCSLDYSNRLLICFYCLRLVGVVVVVGARSLHEGEQRLPDDEDGPQLGALDVVVHVDRQHVRVVDGHLCHRPFSMCSVAATTSVAFASPH